MFTKASIGFIALSIFAATQPVVARERWLERDNRAVYLHPRRFGQEQPAVLQKLRDACPGQVCGVLAGQAVTPLLAAQPECSQQDLADSIIDASKQFDAATQAKMIAIAKEYRQAEKNTPPDFSSNPPAARNSVFCQKAPKNPELNGLVQAQDPANDPNLFFDPAKGATVQKGSQANTAPFGVAKAGNGNAGANAGGKKNNNKGGKKGTKNAVVIAPTPPATTTLVVGDPVVSPVSQPAGGNNGGNNGNANIGNFGKCTVPQIEFGVGFDNRKETSFRPVDLVSFNHGSAQNHAIITQFICDQLVNSCGADQKAKDTCASAKTAAAAATAGTGAQADAFNKVFGINTKFVDVASVDNQGRVVAGTGNGNAPAPAPAGNNGNGNNGNTGNTGNTGNNGNAGNNNGGIGNFGKCSIPKIEFAAGFDGRRETSFQPSDKTSYDHGSAQNIGIITRAMCDQLVNTCGADQTAKDTCATATAAASAAPAKTGAQADAFNKVFGINTNFASVTPIDDQGRVVGNLVTPAPVTTAPAAPAPAAPAPAAPAPAAPAAPAPVADAPGNGNNLQKFSGALGGVVAPAVTATEDGKFQVAGNAAINQKESAIIRSCDVQNNKCADAANASRNQNGFTVSACNAQQQQCIAAARSA
ncbi:hypothetical protein H0H81_005634 [Sphagnurus paluster]|uniref:Uncharacterized protein n=1 Tax=Sphagnurus paluster TaxID=117069 RepID=A0A9P7FXN3_9AGAR|nr:hypothetical protein H0H81_005634 [Sphagnurus paluster]